jgi:hypothetical protein
MPLSPRKSRPPPPPTGPSGRPFEAALSQLPLFQAPTDSGILRVRRQGVIPQYHRAGLKKREAIEATTHTTKITIATRPTCLDIRSILNRKKSASTEALSVVWSLACSIMSRAALREVKFELCSYGICFQPLPRDMIRSVFTRCGSNSKSSPRLQPPAERAFLAACPLRAHWPPPLSP